jgi:hypothetical protein
MTDIDVTGVVVGQGIVKQCLCSLWQYADLLSDGNIGAEDEHTA